MIPKNVANKVLSNLDVAASRIEQLAKSGKMDARLASSLVRELDSFADRFEVSAFGKDSFKRRQATLLKGDADERQYMDTFDNTVKPLKVSADEPYMHESGASARWDSIPTFDADRSSVVMNRPEYAVVGQSEFSNGGRSEKQPSMTSSLKKHKASGPKTWAD
jgi:hypothetical protein